MCYADVYKMYAIVVYYSQHLRLIDANKGSYLPIYFHCVRLGSEASTPHKANDACCVFPPISTKFIDFPLFSQYFPHFRSIYVLYLIYFFASPTLTMIIIIFSLQSSNLTERRMIQSV